MNEKLSRYRPPGETGGIEAIFLAVYVVVLCFNLGHFAWKLSAEYGVLFRRPGKAPIPGALMPDFVDIIPEQFAIFFLLLTFALILAGYYWNSFRQESKSIYLMKRLPDGRELFRRTFAMPVMMVVLTLLTCFALLPLYFGIYMLVTPEQCLQPMQWQKLWADPWRMIRCLF